MNIRIKNIRKKLLSNNWYILNKFTYNYKLTNGNWIEQQRECYDRGNGTAILLYNIEKGTVILTKQFRMPTYINGNKDGFLIEACAGSIENNTPEECVKKETEEETGYRIKKATKIMEVYPSPGAVTEILHLFIAPYSVEMKVSEGGGLAHEAEDIEVLEIPFTKALKMIQKGSIKDLKTIALLQYLKLNNIL